VTTKEGALGKGKFGNGTFPTWFLVYLAQGNICDVQLQHKNLSWLVLKRYVI